MHMEDRQFQKIKSWPDAAMNCISRSTSEFIRTEFHCLEFAEVAELIVGSRPPFGAEFAEYLREWARSDAGVVNPWAEGSN